MHKEGFQIKNIKRMSPAERAEIQPGDKLIKINGSNLFDIVDYRFLIAEERLNILIKRGDRFLQKIINKEFDEEPGIEFFSFTLGPLRRCQNRCIFCFIDQQPEGLRTFIYEKDDDYRLSFFNGNYITLTNINRLEIKRIIRRNLSPLYISIHAIDPDTRRLMMNNAKAGDIWEKLKKLATAGIEMHGQVVICPEINDGKILSQTVSALSCLYPHLDSVALVPVGLTKYRKNLKQLKSVTAKEASQIVEEYTLQQKKFLKEMGTPFVYLADELYLLSGTPLPSHEHYGAYQQLENGVGIARLFLNELKEWKEKNRLSSVNPFLRISLVTAPSGEPFVKYFVQELKKIKNLEVELYVIPHHFWGGNVTVTGLLTGTDLLTELEGKDLGDILFIPGIMLKEGTQLFLDNFDVSTISSRLQVSIVPVNNLFQINKYLLSRKQVLTG